MYRLLLGFLYQYLQKGFLMFGQIFLVVIGMICIVLGVKEGDYIWAFCGFVMATGSIGTIYCLKTGHIFGSIKNITR